MHDCPECGGYGTLSYRYGSDEDMGFGEERHYSVLACSHCGFVDNDSLRYADQDEDGDEGDSDSELEQAVLP